MPLIGAVADDLTGATTTGVLLARSKARTAVFFNEEAAEKNKNANELDAILVSSNSRALPEEEAYEKVKAATQALQRMGIKYFSKRIDTTLRGGIGIEIDAMLDCMEEDTVAVVVPAMPQSKRILVGGFSIIDGVALVRTPVAQDVRTPVKENYIPRLIAGQTRRCVGLITLDIVLKGEESIKEKLIENYEKGNKVIVVDGITLDDVEEIAKACVALNWNMIAVDPGTFTAKLAFHRNLIQKEEDNLPKEDGTTLNKTILIAAGSATPVTKSQMEVLCMDPQVIRVSVDPLPFIDGGDLALEEVEKAINISLGYLQQEKLPKAILIETALHGTILNLWDEDERRNYPKGMSADRINAGLGMIISKLLEKAGREKIAGLYTTGGDTMVNVCYQLGVECIEVLDYVIAQTDVGRLVGNYDGLPIVGKGGLTGNEHTAVDIVERLFKEAKRA
ncbi:MAG: four-carbon acid sugar kinase family protein [Velocimicrobium sp.]